MSQKKLSRCLVNFMSQNFCEISLATLYTGLVVFHCSWIENSTRFLLVLVNKSLFNRFELKPFHHFFSCLLNFKEKLLLIRQCLKFVDILDFLLLVLARNASERYDTVPVWTGPKTGTITDRTRVNNQLFCSKNQTSTITVRYLSRVNAA